MTTPVNSIWSQMNYVPPRGSCNHKEGILTGKCPCLRFMLHPLKSTTSFDCDGCGHHASFHNMENKEEEQIMKRWEDSEREKASVPTRAPKRRKMRQIADKSQEADSIIELDEDSHTEGSLAQDLIPSRSSRRTLL